MSDVNDLARKIQENFDVVYNLYQEAEADGDLLAEELSKTLARLIEVLEENQNLLRELDFQRNQVGRLKAALRDAGVHPALVEEIAIGWG